MFQRVLFTISYNVYFMLNTQTEFKSKKIDIFYFNLQLLTYSVSNFLTQPIILYSLILNQFLVLVSFTKIRGFFCVPVTTRVVPRDLFRSSIGDRFPGKETYVHGALFFEFIQNCYVHKSSTQKIENNYKKKC